MNVAKRCLALSADLDVISRRPRIDDLAAISEMLSPALKRCSKALFDLAHVMPAAIAFIRPLAYRIC